MDQRRYKDQSSASPSLKMMQRHDSKSHSVGSLSNLLSREKKLQDDVRRHSSHGMQSDGVTLIARGPRALSLQSPCCYGSAPSISSKELLHESLSEGSLRRREFVQNISLNEAATIPFGLLYELAEKLNPLGHDTLNKLALLIGMNQNHFNKMYKSSINPAISLLTEGERFLKRLEDLKIALVILELTEAVDLIEKHQLESSKKATTPKIFPQIYTRTVSLGSDTDNNDENIDRPVFTLGDWYDESTDDLKSDRVEGAGHTVMQGDPERREGGILNLPEGAIPPDGTEAFQQLAHLPQHKEAKAVEYEPHSSRSCSKSLTKDTTLPIHSPYTEALQSIRSEGSQVDSGYRSTEHSALSSDYSDTYNSATCMSDDIDGEKYATSSSKSFSQSSGVFCTSDLIDERGGVLYIPNTSISLLVPEGALKRPQMIQLKVITDHTVKGCPQSQSHPRLIPLVSCEPDGLEFLEAADLTLPHCGIIPNPEESVEVYVRRGGGGDFKWKRDEYASRNAVLKLNTCCIKIKHFCDFDVFVRNTGGNIIGKKMRTFPMADCLEQISDDILLSLWMCNDYDQEYNVIVKEKQDLVTNVLLAQYTCYILEASKQSVNVDYLNRSSSMWTLENQQEEIGYHQLWFGSKAKATFRMWCKSSTGGGKLNGTLTIKQKENCESSKFELQHQVRNLLKEHNMQKEEPNLQTQQSYTSQFSVVSVKSEPSLTGQTTLTTPPFIMARRNEDVMSFPPTTPYENHFHIHLPSSSNENDTIISPQSPPTFRVPYELGVQLSRHLDGDDTLGNDWRLLASNLGYSSLDISNFERCKNPTKDILQDACNKRRLTDFDELRAKLKNMQRLDAVNVLDQYLEGKDASPGLMAIEGPENAMKPELSRLCSSEFIISTMEQPSVTTSRVNHAMLVQPLPAIQGTDVTSSEHRESDQKYQADIGGDQRHNMVRPSPPEVPRERGTCSLPCHTSTPLRLSSTADDGEMAHQSMEFVRGQGNDSGIDSPDRSRPQSRRRFVRSITLAPSFRESEPPDSGPASLISETSLVDTKSSQGITSQSSSDDSGLADSPSSEDQVNSPPLEKLNKCFSPGS